jgi:hypothetical protein
MNGKPDTDMVGVNSQKVNVAYLVAPPCTRDPANDRPCAESRVPGDLQRKYQVRLLTSWKDTCQGSLQRKSQAD